MTNAIAFTMRAALGALALSACTAAPEDMEREAGDRSGCGARPPGDGAIVVHYGALKETDPSETFLDAIAGNAEEVIVTRAVSPTCGSGPFSRWRARGDRFRWAYKLPGAEARDLLGSDGFVSFVKSRIDEGWDYVAIDEIHANPSGAIDWSNGTDNSNDLVAGLEELAMLGYDRRVMPYFAGSTVSNPDRSQKVSDILDATSHHARIGMLELYRFTSGGHSVEQHRAYFHDKARNLEMASPGINDRLIVVLGVRNDDEPAEFRYLDDPAGDLASLQRQFAALHQENSLTRRHPGVGAYTWGATRHRPGHYTVYELAQKFRDLSNWYAPHFPASSGGGAGGGAPAPAPSGPTCNEPHEADVGGVCVPSCGAAGGNTCLPAGNHACDPYGTVQAYDCAVCCARPGALTIFRSYHPQKRSHKYSLSPADAEAGGYQLEGPTFALGRDGGGGRTELFQCLKGNDRLFYTTAADCEGAGTMHGPLGYVATGAVEGTRPLHRLYHSGNGAHFYAASDAEKDAAIALGYKYEGVQGYVW